MSIKTLFLSIAAVFVLGFSLDTLGQSNFLIARNEHTTIAVLKTIYQAEETYRTTNNSGNYATLDQLAQDSLIDQKWATGEWAGYSLSIITKNKTKQAGAYFEIVATPQAYGKTGIRSFFVNTDGIIRGADKKGSAASRNDPKVN